MKKTLAILIVLCISVSLFAIGSVKVGGAFNFVTGGTKDFVSEGETIEESEVTYKSSGFGFDVSGSYDIDSQLAVWADFNIVFCSDFVIKYGDFESKLSDQYKYYQEIAKDVKDHGGTASTYMKINAIHIGAGVAYKLPVQTVDVKVGGGLFFERGFGKVGLKASSDDESGELSNEIKAINVGLALYADASYKFTENIAVGITVMPSLGLFNTTTLVFREQVDSEEAQVVTRKASGIKISFSMPVVIGVSYSF